MYSARAVDWEIFVKIFSYGLLNFRMTAAHAKLFMAWNFFYMKI